MNRSLFDNPVAKTTQYQSTSKRYENWYDDQYKPLRRKIMLDTPDPILNRSNTSAKQLKFFGDPSSFKSGVKRTQLSQRSSNIFSNSQTQIDWKPTIKRVNNKAPVVDKAERKHIILTDYNNKYKRNPISQFQDNKQPIRISLNCQKKSRNPIVQGQNKELFQRKGRQYRPDL